MDDEFELVPKERISELEEENAKLKERIARLEHNASEHSVVPSVTKIIQEEFQKERAHLLAELKQTKDVGKNTINNILAKTETLDAKIEDLMEGMTGLLASLSDIVQEMDSFSKTIDKEKMKELEDKIDLLNYHQGTQGTENIGHQLAEIQDFLDKLKILLAQVKPNQMSM